MTLQPLTLTEATAFVERVHRHHKAPQGGLFAVGASEGETIVGAAIVGRPVARMNDDGWTAEVTRLATTGERNACSMLYGACWRAARALGYRDEERGEPECGKDFCDQCGDCLHCYGGDPCCPAGENLGDHFWVIYNPDKEG